MHSTRIFRALKCLCMMLYWGDIWFQALSNTQVDSTEVKPNEDKVFWEIVMCPCRFPNSCKCPALMEGGGSREGASQEAGVSGRGGVCISFTMKLNLLANKFFFSFLISFLTSES